MTKKMNHGDGPPSIIAQHTLSEFPGYLDFHFHDNYEIYLFMKGRGEMQVNQTRYPLKPGTLLIFNSNEVHKAVPAQDGPYERITLHFNPALIQTLPVKNCNLLSCFQNHTPGTGNAAFLTEGHYHAFIRLAKQLIKYTDSKCYAWDAMGLSCLIQILVITNESFFEPEPKTLPFNDLVSQAIGFIDSHISEPLSLKFLAKNLNVDPFYLSHQFKKQAGASPYHYILIQKIACAKQHLSNGASCIQACEQAGFGDYNNFCRTFKKYVGVTPNIYRKTNILH